MSITNITFLEQVIPNNMFCFTNAQSARLYFCDSLEFKHFLASLEIDQAYVVTFDFIYSWLMYNEDDPVISLGKPILITKNSNSVVISTYVKDRIRLVCDTYDLDDTILYNMGDGPGVVMNYSKINLF